MKQIVRGMVDFFMLLVLTGAGDELQGMKKGIMELVDAIVVNKADGSNLQLARETQKPNIAGSCIFCNLPLKAGESKAYIVSSLSGEGVSNLWEDILQFSSSGRNNRSI